MVLVHFPNQEESIRQIGIDIGGFFSLILGSLAKVVWFSKTAGKGGRLHFAKVETSKIDEFIEFIESILNNEYYKPIPNKIIKATGGGSF